MPAPPVNGTPIVGADGVPLEERKWWPVAVGLAAAWVALVQITLWWLDRYPGPADPLGRRERLPRFGGEAPHR